MPLRQVEAQAVAVALVAQHRAVLRDLCVQHQVQRLPRQDLVSFQLPAVQQHLDQPRQITGGGKHSPSRAHIAVLFVGGQGAPALGCIAMRCGQFLRGQCGSPRAGVLHAQRVQHLALNLQLPAVAAGRGHGDRGQVIAHVGVGEALAVGCRCGLRQPLQEFRVVPKDAREVDAQLGWHGVRVDAVCVGQQLAQGDAVGLKRSPPVRLRQHLRQRGLQVEFAARGALRGGQGREALGGGSDVVAGGLGGGQAGGGVGQTSRRCPQQASCGHDSDLKAG